MPQYSDDALKTILRETKTIAMVGKQIAEGIGAFIEKRDPQWSE